MLVETIGVCGYLGLNLLNLKCSCLHLFVLEQTVD